MNLSPNPWMQAARSGRKRCWSSPIVVEAARPVQIDLTRRYRGNSGETIAQKAGCRLYATEAVNIQDRREKDQFVQSSSGSIHGVVTPSTAEEYPAGECRESPMTVPPA